VKEVSFRVDEGEIVGVVGANGAGKTTLVKMLAGIIHPTSGDARVLGHRPWERKRDFTRQISLSWARRRSSGGTCPRPDSFLLLREIYQIPRTKFRDALDYLVSVLDAKEQLTIQVRRLSLGERMKMELIAALLHSPRVVYLDEPTLGLDLTRSGRSGLHPALPRDPPARDDPHEPLHGGHRAALQADPDRPRGRARLRRLARAGRPDVRRPQGRDGAPPQAARARARDAELRAMGTVDTCNDVMIKLRVPRPRVAEVAGELLKRYPVADLAIEEVDVGTIIERIIRARKEADTARVRA
jgi:ABC-2 type transport system ATP-binding protein